MDGDKIVIAGAAKFVNFANGSNFVKLLKPLGLILPRKLSHYHRDIVTDNVSDIRDKLVIINGADIETLMNQFQSKLQELLEHNKILWMQDIDRQFDFVSKKMFRSLEGHANFYRITDSPDGINDRSFFCENLFMAENDLGNVNLLNHSLSNRYFCLMRRQRLPRDKTVLALHSKGLIDRNLVVYHGNKDIVPGLYQQEIWADLSTFHSKLIKQPNFLLSPYYNDHALELIVETMSENIFITEKTIRPLTAGIPFLMVAAKGTLGHIRDKGFMTCDSLWDESYDLIEDLDQRIDAVTDILSYINKKQDGYIKAFNDFQPRVEHNRKLLKSYEEGIQGMIREQLTNIIEELI
jgi:hypothetical protein